MIHWIDINKQKPENEQKCWIRTKDSQTIEAVYSAPTRWFVEFDKWGKLVGRVYELDDILGWLANG